MPKPLAHSNTDPNAFYQQLAYFKGRRIAVGMPTAQWQSELQNEYEQRIAEGALMRLVCGQRCFDRYSMELQPQELVC